MTKSPLISIQGLSKSYAAADHNIEKDRAGTSVLTNIDLDISDGEFIIFVGRSGSGKSTLLNIIGAMDKADGGQLSVDGIVLGELDDEQRSAYRREKIGFIFQAYNLIPTLSVQENLALPLHLTGNLATNKIDEYLQRLDLTHRKHYWPDQLSGGEQQRVAIIRALIHQPKLLIADEPTGNLDSQSAGQVMDLLIDMSRSHNTTLLLATHNMALCELADRVFNIEAGELKPLEAPAYD